MHEGRGVTAKYLGGLNVATCKPLEKAFCMVELGENVFQIYPPDTNISIFCWQVKATLLSQAFDA